MPEKHQWQLNVKQVIRLTLVGISPSDQILVKGYLRVILRVDFDIEWVSPKNPKVDLFIINEAFSSADSVVSLISEANAPVLYIAHSDNKSNTIEDKTLYLKLEQVDILESWLANNVPLIMNSSNLSMQVNTENQPIASDDLPLNSNTINDVKDETAIIISEESNTKDVPNTIDIAKNAVTLINTFNDLNSDKYFGIYSNNELIATFHPKQRVVWPHGSAYYPAFSLNWTVSAVDFNDELIIKNSLNLNTWLWKCSLLSGSDVSRILPLNVKLLLKSWPKPDNNSQKSNVLRMLALTELEPLSVNDISKKTGIATDEVHQCISALYMSGFMDSGLLTLDVYVKKQLGTQTSAQDGYSSHQTSTTYDDTGSMDSSEQFKLNKNYLSSDTNAKRNASKARSGILSRIRATLGI